MNKIILSSVLALFLVGCSDQKSEHKQVKNEVKEEKVLAKAEVAEAESAVSSTVKEKEVPTQELDITTAQEQQAAKELAQEQEAAAKEVVEEVVAPAVEEVPKEIATVTPSVDGKKLFTKCAGCHGMSAEKHALGKSQIIKGWDVAKVEIALKGYKDGTYGGASKALMKGQVANLSDADIKALAEYISKL